MENKFKQLNDGLSGDPVSTLMHCFEIAYIMSDPLCVEYFFTGFDTSRVQAFQPLILAHEI